MSGEKGSTFANDLLKLVFQGTAFSWSANTNLYVALHTADPTAGGSQTSSEISYTGYSRVTVARTSGGWTVTTNSVSPVAAITFPASSGGAGGTVTYFSIGTASSGAGEVLYAGPVSPSIVVSNGVTPQLTTSTAITEV